MVGRPKSKDCTLLHVYVFVCVKFRYARKMESFPLYRTPAAAARR